jgi:hypothetical protein
MAGACAIHGRRLSGWIIEPMERLTVRHIDNECSAEARRVMLERYV